MGGEVIHSDHEVADKRAFFRSLRQTMRGGRYNILHCHHDVMSAVYLMASAGLPFRKRIVHVHNTSMSLPTASSFKATLFREPMRQICLRMSDHVVGISKDALNSLIGDRPARPGRDRVVHYGVDTSKFLPAAPDPVEFRLGLGLRPSAKVLLFVGRMVDYKNPCFVIEVLRYLSQNVPDAAAVFAGAGPLEGKVKELAGVSSLEGRVRVLGFRDDVPALMQASDVLIWPGQEEPKEGLGLGIVEAQAAGQPILMSRGVPEEAVVLPELVDVLPLAAGPKAWANAILEILKRPRPGGSESLAKVALSSFSMDAGVSNLMALYEDSL
jgi:glycosyltransferase involved in cell wall biosynthesis